MKATLRSVVYVFARRAAIVLQNAQRTGLLSRFKSCGRDVSIYMPVRIDNPEQVEVGSNVGIGPFVHMWGGGGIKIGNRVMIGAHVALTSQGHDWHREIMSGTLVNAPIIIEDDASIGTHCVILPGVTIGKGAVIGAGSVINRNVDPNTIVVTGRKRQDYPRRW